MSKQTESIKEIKLLDSEILGKHFFHHKDILLRVLEKVLFYK